MSFDKLIFFDVESTGFKENRIVSIGLLYYENGKLKTKKNITINPNTQIEIGASKVNGFTNDMVKDKPTFDEIWDEIKQYFEDTTWIGHNVKYDNKCILGELKRYKLQVPKHDTLCTMENAKILIPKTKIKNYKLDTVAQYFGINFTEEQHHDAFFDTIAAMRIYNKLVELSDGDLVIKEEEK